MHDNGVGTGDGEPRRKRPWVSLVLALCLVVGTGVAASLVFGKPKAAPHRHRAPLYAKAWDPQIAPLAAIVEKDRGLKFHHPVFVELLTSSQFTEQIHGSDVAAPAERVSALHTEAMMRALGEISDSQDLLKQMATSSDAGVLGFYSYDNKRVWIRGAALTPETRLTVVHELTHALDDQYFDLGAKMRAFEESNSGGALAFDAIIEGDARRIEGKYRATYSKNDLLDLPAEERAQLASAPVGDHGFPGFLSAQSIAAYPLGLTAVTRIARKGGNAAVNALFRTPPTHEVLITQPWLLGTSWRPKAVSAPSTDAGSTKITTGEFGALDLYLLLSESVPLPQALAASDAWGGDRYVTYSANNRPCVRIAVDARDRAGSHALWFAMSRWAVYHDGSYAPPMRGLTVTLTACSPGAGFSTPVDVSEPALELLNVRNLIEAQLEKDGFNRRMAVCLVRQLPGRFSTHLLETGAFSQRQQQVLQSIAQSCHAYRA